MHVSEEAGIRKQKKKEICERAKMSRMMLTYNLENLESTFQDCKQQICKLPCMDDLQDQLEQQKHSVVISIKTFKRLCRKQCVYRRMAAFDKPN